MGYSIAVKRGGYLRKHDPLEPPVRDDRWRARVQIGRQHYQALKAYLLEIATTHSLKQLAIEFYSVPFEPYAPVRQQMLNILRVVNNKRRANGLAPLYSDVLRYRRRIVKPFDAPESPVAL
jgi:hypothetical protein